MKNNYKIDAVIFDLAGTVIDFGSMATIQSMKKIFADKKIILKNETIKEDMGINKKKHIIKILNKKIVKKKWLKIYKKRISQNDLDNMSKKFDLYLVKYVKENLNVIPNAQKIFKILKKNNIKTAVTTGYSKKIVKIIINYLKKNNINFDNIVCDDDVRNGRPYPEMCKKNLKKLNVRPKNVIKIDDSVSGVIEGKKSNLISIGLIFTGIQFGFSYRKFKEIENKKKNILRNMAKDKFLKAGANFVVNDLYEFESFLKKGGIS